MNLRRLAVAVAVGAAGWLGFAAPAEAHAVLEETTPAADSVIDRGADEVVLRFSEGVDPALGGVKVFAPGGGQADRGRVEQADGDRVLRVPVDAVEQGTYTVAWSVVSEDSHSISGSFVFSVGRVTGAADVATAGRSGVRLLAGIARWAAFAGTLVVVGGLAFRLLVLPVADVRDRRQRLGRLMLAGAAAAFAGASSSLLAQVALAAGRSLPDTFGLLGDAITSTRFAALAFSRVMLAVAALLLLAAPGLLERRVGAVGVGVAGVGLLVVPGLAGHAWTVEPRWASVSVDAVHLGAAAVWVGGLAALIAVAPGSGAARPLAARFSAVALGAVGAVAVTGAMSGYLQVRSVDALTATGYGKLLVAKVAAVAVLVALGWVNRRRLLALLPGRDTLFRVVAAELSVAVVVVGLTAALVNRPPARNEATRGPFAATVALANDPAGGQVQLQVDPARVGQNDVHLYFLDAQGLPRPVDAIEMTVGRPGVPARRVTVTPVTPDHASAYGVSMPSAGTWTLTITAVRQGLPAAATVEVPIR